MNPTELNYQAVNTFDTGCTRPLTGSRTEFRSGKRMESGKKYRQFLAGVLGSYLKEYIYIESEFVMKKEKERDRDRDFIP